MRRIIFGLYLFLFTLTSPALSSTIHLPSNDVFIHEMIPDENFSSYDNNNYLTQLYVGKNTSNYSLNSLIKFDLTGATALNLINPYIEMYTTYAPGYPVYFDIFQVTKNWDENTVTWNTQPSTENIPLLEKITYSHDYTEWFDEPENSMPNDHSIWIRIYLNNSGISLLQQWIDTTDSVDNYGIMLKTYLSTQQSSYRLLYSKDYTGSNYENLIPKLYLDGTPASTVPEPATFVLFLSSIIMCIKRKIFCSLKK